MLGDPASPATRAQPRELQEVPEAEHGQDREGNREPGEEAGGIAHDRLPRPEALRRTSVLEIVEDEPKGDERGGIDRSRRPADRRRATPRPSARQERTEPHGGEDKV